MATPTSTITMMIPASTNCPRKPAKTAAIKRMITSGFTNISSKSATPERRCAGAGSLGPNCLSRACCDVKPCSGAGDICAGGSRLETSCICLLVSSKYHKPGNGDAHRAHAGHCGRASFAEAQKYSNVDAHFGEETGLGFGVKFCVAAVPVQTLQLVHKDGPLDPFHGCGQCEGVSRALTVQWADN